MHAREASALKPVTQSAHNKIYIYPAGGLGTKAMARGQHWTIAKRNLGVADLPGKRQVVFYCFLFTGSHISGHINVAAYQLLMMQPATGWHGTCSKYCYKEETINGLEKVELPGQVKMKKIPVIHSIKVWEPVELWNCDATH